MNWTLDILVKRFDECVAKEAPRKGEEFDEFDSLSADEQNQLLLATADRYFDKGRYSMKTEWSIEMFELEEAERSLHDLRQIDALAPQQRKRLTFYQRLKALCYPLFRHQPLDLTEQPFGFAQGDYSIANDELRDFLYNTEHIYLAQVMTEGLAVQQASSEDATAVAYNELHQYVHFGHLDKKNSKEENRTSLDKLVDAVWDAHNHRELGRRMGLTYMSQSIYDMTDTFLCRTYDYRQVDYAKELAAFIEERLIRQQKKDETFGNEIAEALDTLAKKHGVVFADKQFTLRYIFIDLLGFGENEDFDDEDLDLEDDE